MHMVFLLPPIACRIDTQILSLLKSLDKHQFLFGIKKLEHQFLFGAKNINSFITPQILFGVWIDAVVTTSLPATFHMNSIPTGYFPMQKFAKRGNTLNISHKCIAWVDNDKQHNLYI